MHFRPLFAAVLGSSLAASLAASPALAESATIRIEPRPYYGAVVTLEQGVRVWRPLPPTQYMVINPDHRTPLSLSLANVNETINNNVVAPETPGMAAVAPYPFAPDTYGVPGFFGRKFRHGRHFHHHRSRGLGPGRP